MVGGSRSEGHFAIIGIAASAGGVVALRDLLATLPPDLSVPVLVVQHLDRRRDTEIAEIFGRRTSLRVTLARDGESALPGNVYVAPPDHHLLVSGEGRLSLSQGHLVHFVRPSADLLFESMAQAYGDRVLACVLTGTGSDGATGVTVVKARGGTVIVQDPSSAAFAGMPTSAAATGCADFVLPLDEIGSVVVELVEGVARDGTR
jgi:two-component system chemotaxis response regulator CheB